MIVERKHIRLKNWDYSSEGIYYITICCFDRHSYFGSIVENKVNLSDIGLAASNLWLGIPNHFKQVKLDEFIVIPNHIHGLIMLDYFSVGSCHGMTLQPASGSNIRVNQFSKLIKNSVSVIVNQYKSSVTRYCNKNGLSDFRWQPRFHDQILNNEKSIDSIREYIFNNPRNWKEDELYN